MSAEDFRDLKSSIFTQQSGLGHQGVESLVRAMPIEKVKEYLDKTPLKGRINEEEMRDKLIDILKKEQ